MLSFPVTPGASQSDHIDKPTPAFLYMCLCLSFLITLIRSIPKAVQAETPVCVLIDYGNAKVAAA